MRSRASACTRPACCRVPSTAVAEWVSAGRLRATTDFSAVADLDTINICVPTPLRKTKDPDMSYVVSAVETIAEHLHPGMLVILESTTYPGTTDELVKPILERGGLVAGRDFFLAFSPERVDPGNPRFNTHNVPKLDPALGGFDLASIERLDARTLASFDCVAILTDHTAFDYALVAGSARLVVDTRNALRGHAGAHLFRLGAPRLTAAPTEQEAVA